MLFDEIRNIIALSYSELGSTGHRIAHNFDNGYNGSKKQKALIRKGTLIQMELKTVLDHVVYDDDGNITGLLRSTDEQINKSLTYLIDLSEIQDYSVGPTLFHKAKPVIQYQAPRVQFQYSIDALVWYDTPVLGVGYFRTSSDAGLTWSLPVLFFDFVSWALKVSKAGDTMTGPLAMSTQKITGLGNGTNPNDAVNKGQLDGVATAAATDATTKANTAENNAKAYSDGLVTGLLDDRGNYNPNTNSNLYPNAGGSGIAGAIKKGDLYVINGLGPSVTTTMGTKVVEDGDTTRALVDSPGQTESNWATLQNNLGYTPLNKAGDNMLAALGMGGNKITNLAPATNPTDAVRFDQLPSVPTFGSWTDITLINGWAQGFLLEKPQYRTGPGNMVYLRGYIDGSLNSATACLSGLPAPAKAAIFFVGVVGASTSVQYQFSVDTAGGGDIQAQSTINTNNESISLDGLCYATN